MGERKEITLSELRSDLPNILWKVNLLGESFVVTKNGKKAFIIQPVSDGDEEATSDTTKTPDLATC
jgi:prevent-host-death family protein